MGDLFPCLYRYLVLRPTRHMDSISTNMETQSLMVSHILTLLIGVADHVFAHWSWSASFNRRPGCENKENHHPTGSQGYRVVTPLNSSDQLLISLCNILIRFTIKLWWSTSFFSPPPPPQYQSGAHYPYQYVMKQTRWENNDVVIFFSGCQSTGAHYNPFNLTHGGPNDVIR